MTSQLKKISVNPNAWLITSWVVLLLPLLLLGSPGFYNDDFNSYQAIEQLGLSGAIQNWMNEYGSAYRPIGISFLYGYYSIMPQNSYLLYFGYQLLYITLSFVIYREIYIFTKSSSTSVFLALFFLFFPFNATVYWQISSLMMVIATIFALVLMRQIISLSNRVFIISIVGWIVLLFTYEQLLGLAAVIGFLIATIHFEINFYNFFKKIIFPLLIIVAVSTIFLVVYFTSDINPKVVSLKSLNAEYLVQQEEGNVVVKQEEGKVISSNKKSGESQAIFSGLGRMDHITRRIDKAISFLASSISYSLQGMLNSGIAGYIMISAIAVLGVMSFFLPLYYPIFTKLTSLLYIFTGTLWVGATLAPFFLYDEVHIPPYTLMLPSIGLGIIMLGVFQLTINYFSDFFTKLILKVLFIFIVISFPLVQYGFYFGLNEELRYWENIATEINQGNAKIFEDKIIFTEIKGKKNFHIFWLENAVGLRYISDLIGEELNRNIVGVSRSGKKIILSTTVK
jgi:hypothetical protein